MQMCNGPITVDRCPPIFENRNFFFCFVLMGHTSIMVPINKHETKKKKVFKKSRNWK